METMRRRRHYSDTDRARILKAMSRDGLSYAQAAKRSRVSEVTIWKWRKASQPARARQTRRENGSLAAMVRSEVQARVRALLPEVVHEEVSAVLRLKR
mgnify:FL=1